MRGLTKNVKTICVSELLNDIGASVYRPALPVLYRMLGATPLQYGMIEGLSSFFGMVAAAPAGELSDRVGRRRLYYLGHAVMGFVRVTWGLISSFWLLLPLRWLYRLGMAVRYAARDPLLAESSTSKTRGLAYAAYELADCVGSFMGPFLPILVLGYVGQNIRAIRMLFFLSAVPNLLSTLLIVLFVGETAEHDDDAAEAGFAAKLRLMAENRNLLHFMGVTSLSTLFAMTVDLEVLYITYGPLKATAFLTTVMYMFWTATTVLAALPAGRVVDRMGRKSALVLAFAFHSVSMTAIIVYHYNPRSLFLVPVAFSSLGLYDSFLSVSGKTFVADSASSENRGMIMGLYTTLEGVFKRSLAPMVAGFLFSLSSSVTPFIVGLAVSLVTIVLLTKMISEPSV
ncbi:MAG: MFS transporter [Candidatus Bathyarchaeia archaeon]